MSIKTVWGPFVPVTAHAEWLKKTLEYRDEYFAVRDEILAKYEQILAEVVRFHQAKAALAYRTLKKTTPGVLSDEELASPRVFLQNANKRIEGLFPSKKRIEESFTFKINQTYIDLPRLAG